MTRVPLCNPVLDLGFAVAGLIAGLLIAWTHDWRDPQRNSERRRNQRLLRLQRSRRDNP